MEQSVETRSLRDYLRAIKARKRLVIATTVAAAAAAILLSLAKTPTYEATSKVSVSADFNQGQNQSSFPGSAGLEGAAVVTRNDVLRMVSAQFGGDPSADDLRSDVSGIAETNLNVVDITAKADTAHKAASVANAVATSMAKVTHDQQANALNEIAANTEDPQRAAFLRFQAESAQPIRIDNLAQVPDSPASPKPVRDAIFAALLGFVLGIGIALLRDALDRRVSDAHEMQSTLGLPLLGYVRADALGVHQIPVNGTGIDDDNLETFRILRANAEHLATGQELSTLAVTSPLAEEGKSTVAAWYAYVNALAGRRTILIEADLRRPVLAERFGLDPTPGLSDHLLGEAGLSDGVHSINVQGPTAEPLAVVPAGAGAAQPAELLGSDRFDQFLDHISKTYDLVVLDCPPLLPVGDTLEIIPKVDGILLCIRIGETKRDQAVAARTALSRLPDKPIGLVITGLKPGGEEDYAGQYTAYGSTRAARV
jgi:capsular exopolysaccharide synthesis family protein